MIICYWDNCNPAISRITFNEFRGVSVTKENAFSIRRFKESKHAFQFPKLVFTSFTSVGQARQSGAAISILSNASGDELPSLTWYQSMKFMVMT